MMEQINIKNILTVAQAEKRLTRRLKRYWLFVILAFAAGTFIFGYYNVLHSFFSSFSATLGTINPRYLLSVPSIAFQFIFTIGIVFIAFDVRARDVRERIVEVLDCRPVSNLELVLGRFFALFQLAWFPVLILCTWLQFLGWVLPRIGAPIGMMIQPLSVLSFITLVAIPSFAFSISLVYLLTLLVRNRVLSVVLSLGAIGGLFYAMTQLPIWAYPLVDNFGLTVASPFPSDLISRVGTPAGWFQRTGMIVISAAFLGFASAIHPRLDDSNRKRIALFSAATFAAGFALMLASITRINDVSADAAWIAAHEAANDAAIPDIVRMDAAVDVIDPGSDLQAEVTVEIQAPPTGTLSSALFSLNLGLTVESVTSNGQALDFTHEAGLLDVKLPSPLAAGQHTTLTLTYGGAPNNQFAYLDSRLKYETFTDFNARGLSGTEPGMFYNRFVALMPGTYWLPLAGNDIGRDDTRTRPRDFFNVAVEIEVPEGWLVAGPSRREEVAAQNGGSRFRFAPEPQVTEVGLVAAEYESFATDISNIHFEFLMYPGHTRNFEVLAPMREEIEKWVESRLSLAASAGLVYPFDSFTIAEVPNGLRVYEGGWRMDTALAPPGMMLMAESGFPTSRFDFTIRTLASNTATGTADDQGMDFNQDSFQVVPFERVLNFFTSDLSGGNIFNAASRSYFTHQTAATGQEALALDFIMDMLATLVVSDERYYFSMYNDINSTVTNLINTVLAGGTAGESLTQRTIDSFSANVEVWNSALGQSLAAIDTTRDPEQTINTLTLKGGELAQAIYDVLGAQRSGEFLAALVNQHRGGTYTLDDVVSTLALYDEGLSRLFMETINSTELPGFVVENADMYRLSDGLNGEQRYQLLVALRNDEPVAGFTRFTWSIPQDDSNEFFSSEPIRIDGRSTVEFGIVLTTPPAAALVTPYLSLNRVQFLAEAFDLDDVRQVPDAEPFEGVRPLPWSDASERIIADDLDLSFTVTDATGTSTPDRPSPEGGRPYDQGIQISEGQAPDDFMRITSPAAFGKYRHTFVSIIVAEGDKTATLTSEIPTPGLYDLEIYIPAAAGFRQDNMRGTWDVQIESANGLETIAFDNREAIAGWNLIGSYELPKGEVKVVFKNSGTSITVIVDAIAWTPVNTNNEAAQQ
jgi:ABC-type transport system involved in multi-copper enzyme maturation permease subunit